MDMYNTCECEFQVLYGIKLAVENYGGLLTNKGLGRENNGRWAALHNK